MKHLLLIRHGSAAPARAGLSDFNRPLTSRGEAECRKMAPLAKGWFRRRNLTVPELILSSPARRTRETIEQLSPLIYGETSPVRLEEILYLPSTEECLEVLWAQDDRVDCLALCSHNPGITALADYLFGPLHRGFSPCGMALGRLDVKRWYQADRPAGELLEFLNP